MSRCRILLLIVAVLGLLAACSGGSSEQEPIRRYVAIGDSYVSGPGIGDQNPASRDCQRSDQNYPHLVAKRLKRTKLVDVSCGGSTTVTVQSGSRTAQGDPTKPQLDALTPATRFVTVGVGGNDGNLLLGLFVHCLVKTSATDASCAEFTANYATTNYRGTLLRVAATLSKIKKLAPNADIVLVGYLRIVPDSGQCRDLQVSESNRTKAQQVETALDTALRDAAKSVGLRFVDMRAISQGHDACAGKAAWVNGSKSVPGDGVLLHPNEAGMRAVADHVVKAFGTSSAGG